MFYEKLFYIYYIYYIILFILYLFRRITTTYHYLKCKLTFIPKTDIYFYTFISRIIITKYLLFLEKELNYF